MTDTTTATMDRCAYCGQPAGGSFSIHRDGFGEGPEVDLCNDCGGSPPEVLSCEQIWERIAQVNGRPVNGGMRG
jgi:hypothetical protein